MQKTGSNISQPNMTTKAKAAKTRDGNGHNKIVKKLPKYLIGLRPKNWNVIVCQETQSELRKVECSLKNSVFKGCFEFCCSSFIFFIFDRTLNHYSNLYKAGLKP